MVDHSAVVFKAMVEAWDDALRQKDIHAAIATGISAYMFARSRNDDHRAALSLEFAYVAIKGLLEQEKEGVGDESTCSFCGRSEITLGAGPDAFICIDCVEIFHQTLKPKPRPTDRT